MLLCPKCETLLDISTLAPGTRFTCPFCERPLVAPRPRPARTSRAPIASPPPEPRPRAERSSLELQVIDLPIESPAAPGRPEWVDWKARRESGGGPTPRPRW